MKEELRESKPKIGLVTLDMRFAGRVRKAAAKFGAEVLHASSAEELPLSVKVAVAKRGEGLRLDGRKTLYLEDYGSVEELVERAVEVALGAEDYSVAVVAVDPGKNMGAVYILDGKLVRTARYGVIDRLIDEAAYFLRSHSRAEKRCVMVGMTSRPEIAGKIADKIRRALYGEDVEVMLVDESSTSKGLLPRARGMSKDEYSALLLLIRNILKLG